jgi:hypothetical protein
MLQRYATRIFAEQAWIVRISLFFCFFYSRQTSPPYQRLALWASASDLALSICSRQCLKQSG